MRDVLNVLAAFVTVAEERSFTKAAKRLDDEDLVLQAALDAAGLAIVDGALAAPHVKDGSLIQVLEDWMAPFPGFFLYYPQRAQQPAAITAVIETFRLQR